MDDGTLTIVHRLSSIVRELYSQTAAKAEFQTVHLAIIRFVIVTAQVQQAVQNQLRDFFVKLQAMLICLSRSLLD